MTTPAVYLRRRLIVFGASALVLLSAVLGAGYTIQAAAAPLPAPVVTVSAPSVAPGSEAQIAWPPFRASAIGALGFDGVLASSGTNESIPIASITKTITALVVLDAKPIAAGEGGPTIEFTADDVAILGQVRAVGGSWAYVVAGEKLTEREAIAAMLLPSANNYAISLTNWAFGSQQAFLVAARAWLDGHNLTGTHLVDSPGLDPGSRSTLTDLVEIAKLVAANDVLAEIVATPSITLPGMGTEANTNRILGQAGIDGIKTGFTDEAGHALMFSATATVAGREVRLVGVTLGASSYQDLWNGVPPLVESAMASFHQVTLVSKGDRVGTVTTAWGESTTILADRDESVFVFSAPTVSSRVITADPAAIARGTHVGSIEFDVNGEIVSVPLRTATKLSEPDLWWRMTHPDELAG